MAGIHLHQISQPGQHAPGVGFEQPFEMLDACHERVERMLGLLGKIREHVKQSGADPQARDAARDVMRYFDQAGPHHHEDEERHVFPPLLAQRDPAVVAVVIQLKQDHREMEAQWARVRVALMALVKAGEGWPGFSADDQQCFDTYDALYRRHLLDENGVVYPAARSVIRGAALEAMGAEMMGRRGVFDGVHLPPFRLLQESRALHETRSRPDSQGPS
ncbi:MAG: hemerythrin domain-containing protein [Gemmobacter sp.]|nr:hemerythrin domain-containing protein [Gemmobacter sp.]